ncbi:hypothetical protein [Neorhizobium sp. LjRoot104]|uniref:hypothetical protein n=1 Tax=Neorhizobium sp. LjRoot104 TaxID=3342254 RepID=UPI003ECC754E
MDEDAKIAAELKELEYSIAHLENEKQKGWLSTSKQNQLAEDRARRDEIVAKAAPVTVKDQATLEAIKVLKYLA